MSETQPKRIVSGIQPTGTIHLGNYLGAIKNWVAMQDEGECFFFLADLHALTMPISQVDLRNNVISMAAMLMACGIDREKSSLFSQKMVPQHTELQWHLSCIARMGWLNRMTQYKDKGGNDAEAAFRSGFEAGQTIGAHYYLGGVKPADQAWSEYDQNRPSVGVGLFTYPVLQAADVLLYDATHVPVGDDQDQHLQLVRDISDSFNGQYAVELFTKPQAVMTGPATRVMSLKNGRRKMSKSDDDAMTRISFTDTNDEIAKKIKRATSDSDLLPYADAYTDAPEVLLKDRPEALNLVNIFAAVIDQAPYRVLEQSLGNKGFGNLKGLLTDALIELIGPIRTEYYRLRECDDFVVESLREGAETALPIAKQKMYEVRSAVFGY